MRIRAALAKRFVLRLECAGLGNFAAEIALDHAWRAAGEIAQAVGKVAVVAGDQRVVAEIAVLPEHNFAQQVVAQRLDAQHVDDRARPHHVALGLAHFLAVEKQPAVRPDCFGSGKSAAIRNAGQ